jgi:hypothetical protein
MVKAFLSHSMAEDERVKSPHVFGEDRERGRKLNSSLYHEITLAITNPLLR